MQALGTALLPALGQLLQWNGPDPGGLFLPTVRLHLCTPCGTLRKSYQSTEACNKARVHHTSQPHADPSSLLYLLPVTASLALSTTDVAALATLPDTWSSASSALLLTEVSLFWCHWCTPSFSPMLWPISDAISRMEAPPVSGKSALRAKEEHGRRGRQTGQADRAKAKMSVEEGCWRQLAS